MRHLRRHADAFAQRGVRMNGLTDVHGVSAHLNGQRNLTNHVASMRADHAAAQDLVVTVRFGAVIKQQFRDVFVAAVCDGVPEAVQGNKPFLTLMTWALAWSSVRPTQATSGSV